MFKNCETKLYVYISAKHAHSRKVCEKVTFYFASAKKTNFDVGK